MDDISLRLTNRENQPDNVEVESWIGEKAFILWKLLQNYIDQNYPGVFTPQWLYGGKKHGWSLRYKKSRSFCTFIPERGRFLVLIVFGAEERAKVEAIRNEISADTLKEYDDARTYHDGKWLVLNFESEKVLADIRLLLNVKRKRVAKTYR